MKKGFFKQFVYRCWQFYKAVFPEFKEKDWENALLRSDERLKPLLCSLGKAEKSHILRILSYIANDERLSVSEKMALSDFALVHDIGKAITKPSLAFKVAKVLFKLNGNAHCIAGARAVWHLTRNKALALKVLKHHIKPNKDDFISAFQNFDDMA